MTEKSKLTLKGQEDQKNKLIRLYKQRIEKAELGEFFDIYSGRDLVNLGTERRVYHGVDALDSRKKVEHTIPEAVWLYKIKIGDKDDKFVCVGFQCDYDNKQGEYEEEVPWKKFFGLLKGKDSNVYQYYEEYTTATYSINYGFVESELTKEEYDELIKLGKDKHEDLMKIHMAKIETQNVAQAKKDLENFNKKNM